VRRHDAPRRNWEGLQVVKKTYCGVRIGYVVGWWRGGGCFASFRQGIIFPTRGKAEDFRDDVEKRRKGNFGVQFEALEEI